MSNIPCDLKCNLLRPFESCSERKRSKNICDRMSSKNICDMKCAKNIYEMNNDSMVFQQNDLFASAFPAMEEIRRQGKLCDVVLKVS